MCPKFHKNVKKETSLTSHRKEKCRKGNVLNSDKRREKSEEQKSNYYDFYYDFDNSCVFCL